MTDLVVEFSFFPKKNMLFAFLPCLLAVVYAIDTVIDIPDSMDNVNNQLLCFPQSLGTVNVRLYSTYVMTRDDAQVDATITCRTAKTRGLCTLKLSESGQTVGTLGFRVTKDDVSITQFAVIGNHRHVHHRLLIALVHLACDCDRGMAANRLQMANEASLEYLENQGFEPIAYKPWAWEISDGGADKLVMQRHFVQPLLSYAIDGEL